MSKHQALKSLCDAAERGDVEAAEEALSQGAKINGRVEYGKTPVMFAIQNAHIPMIRFLKSKGARLNMLDEDQEHPMIYIFTNRGFSVGKDGTETKVGSDRKMEVLRELLSLGANPNAMGEFGTPALHYAAGHLDGSQVMELIRKGMDVLPLDELGDATFLHVIVRSDTISEHDAMLLIGEAVGAGVDVNAKNSNGATAMDCAKAYEKNLIVEALVAAGATIEEVAPASKRRMGPR